LQSTNTDVKIVVASYLVMFLYVSLTLGGGIPWHRLFGDDGPLHAAGSLLTRTVSRIFKGETTGASDGPPSVASETAGVKRLKIASWLPAFLSVNSKFGLGLFGIVIVLIAVSSSVGFFSLLGVRVTLIIAEVIPFLVLAVGVDNVFILVHELDRQNALHGPGIEAARRVPGINDDLDDEDGSLLSDGMSPSHLPAEERVARALARMGPSILLSSVTEVVAFALGALVPMPAVRNFALYAAGSVFLGAVLQVTVFVSAMTLDLKRVEVSLGMWECDPNGLLR
jgi:Niemann-Pick C1 protein